MEEYKVRILATEQLTHDVKRYSVEKPSGYAFVPGQATELAMDEDGWREERSGLHEREFIETRRHWFTKPVRHHTCGGVNVLNLIEGPEAVVESPDGAFEPFLVHYAETFIVPAAVGPYTIRPTGQPVAPLATIKASVRT